MGLLAIMLALLLGKEPLLDSLVSELGANDYHRRERATVLLGHLGRLAYPQLRKAMASKDLEVRLRAEALMRPILLKAFSRARNRHIIIKHKITFEGKTILDYRFFGTVIKADGKHAYILTATAIALLGRGSVVEWDGRTSPAHYVTRDDDSRLALLVIPSRRKLAPLPLATGRTKGYWWSDRVQLKGTFKEDMRLLGAESKDQGCGVFTLDEATLEVQLTGVNAGALFVNWGAPSEPWAPGVGRIRKFLARCQTAPLPKMQRAPGPDAPRMTLFLRPFGR